MKFNISLNNISYPQDIYYPTSGKSKTKETITEEDLKIITKENLEEGEVICSKCKGVGFVNKIESDNTSIFKGSCSKCHGTGKLDWIENVLGKKPVYGSAHTSGSGSLSVSGKNVNSGFHGTSGIGIRDVIIKQAAEQMAKKIDDEILEMIIKGG